MVFRTGWRLCDVWRSCRRAGALYGALAGVSTGTAVAGARGKGSGKGWATDGERAAMLARATCVENFFKLARAGGAFQYK